MSQIKDQCWSTVRDLPKLYPAFSEAAIRWIIFNEHKNGFSKCIRRVGRKVLINLSDFEDWVESHGRGGENE